MHDFILNPSLDRHSTYSADLLTALKLDAQSRALCYGTEGATDPQVYRDLVGNSAHEVSI
jgi:hypothetical protein